MMDWSAKLGFPADLAARIDGLSFKVVGGSGWMGQVLLHMLARSLGDSFAERVRVYGSSERIMVLANGGTVPVLGLDRLGEERFRRTILFHLAFLTKDRVGTMAAAAFIDANRRISGAIASAARHAETQALVALSSGAVYRPDRSLERDLDHNPYGALKVEEEERLAALAQAGAMRVVVPRVFNVAGPYINKTSNYVLACILLDILAGRPIRLRANHPVIRSYLHARDLLALALSVALDETASPFAVFDTAGEREIEVGVLARLAASVLGREDLIIERPAMSGALPDRYVGDSACIDALWRRYHLTTASLEDQIIDTATYLSGLRQT